MRRNLLTRWLCLTLAALLAVTALPPASFAQDNSIDPVSSSSDSDGNNGEEVMFGLLIVVVGILVWLGIKSDWDRRDRAGVQGSIEDYAQAGELPAGFEDQVQSGW